MAGDPWREGARRIERVARAVDRGGRRAEVAAAGRFATVASLLAPVETGTLARSITAHDDGTVTVEGTARGYYDIVETGGETAAGSHQAPQPYLRPAAALVAAQVPAIARREIGAEVAREVAAIKAGRPGR